MDCKEFYFKGKEDLDIHVYKWTSKIVNPKAVVQIAHGMSETAIRYEEFAKKLMISYINEIEDIKLATTKVLGVYNEQ